MKKSLEELAAEYRAAAQIITGRIAARRQELKTLPPASRRASVIKSELQLLYVERRDTLATALHLAEYYAEHKTNSTKTLFYKNK